MKIILSNKVEVEMREPKVRDMRIVADEKNEVTKEIKLISNLSEMSVDEVEDLSMKDYSKLQKQLISFLS